MRITAVIPTYNEAASVGPLLARLMALPLDVGVLFVDDRSPDGTAARVREVAKEYSGRRIEVLEREEGPRGLGLAYRDGFHRALESQPDAILQMDADGQHPPEALPSMVEAMRGGAGSDLVIASRYAEGGSARSFGRRRRWLSRMGGGLARVMLRLPVQDLTGGFKLWRADLLAAMDLTHVESRGYVFQIEMTLRAHRMGARVVEVPFEFGTRGAGESKMSGAIVREAAWRMACWTVRPPQVSRYHPTRGG